MRIITLIILSSFSAFAQDISHLKIEQPPIERLFIWNNLIIVEKYKFTTDKYYVCDTTRNTLVPLKISNDLGILDLAETESVLYAVTKRNTQYYLYTSKKNEDKWEIDSVSLKFLYPKKFKLLAIDDLMIVVTDEKLYSRVSNSTWQEMRFPSNEKAYVGAIPKHYLLTKNALYLGFNNGEWGGSLWEIGFSIKKRKTLNKKAKLILENNIEALEFSSEGEIWIACGLSHMRVERSEIYKYSNSRLTKVLWSTPMLQLEKKSDLSAFYLNNRIDPYFIATRLGVFKISTEKLDKVLAMEQFFWYRKTYDKTPIITGSSPVGLYVDNADNIFIAQRSLGVFVYTKSKDNYLFRQITFD